MLQNIPKEKILEIVKAGPTLPAKVAKAIGGGADSMLIGAMLSSLIGSGEVCVSTLKVGGSPLYYAPDQESRLEEFISYLNEKDRRAFTSLKDGKVLVDSTLDPLTRVSLRAIKDFAKPFELDVSGQKVLFWRFYSVSRDEALKLAKNPSMNVEAPKIEAVVESRPTPIVSAPVHPVVPASAVPESKPSSVESSIHPIKQQVLEPVKSIESPAAHERAHEIKHVVHKHKEETPHPEHHKAEHHIVHAHKEEKPATVEKQEEVEKIPVPKVEKESKPIKAEKPVKIEYDFYALVLDHIFKKHLDLISKEKIKKSEYNIILKNHDTNEYIYCKAKDKSILNEGDLAPALIFAQNKKMPCLFLSTGSLTKNVEAMMSKEFSGMVFERIPVPSN